MDAPFATPEEALAHDAWLRAKVQAAIDEPGPSIPHDQVMAELRARIEDLARADDPTRLAK
jgi:hypothetical protein